ncbi:MAG: exodeoxyribonuclease V subunit beta [Methylococcales bacterium]|nr:exodeoxyribonuclease V subunit beta [Methylococcales bacterium]
MNPAIALNPLTFPLSGSRLIEASAGTGKTYTIAALYVRLILGHHPENPQLGRELLPPDILVVTFTEAATKELRERIRTRLTQAARFFRGLAVDSDAFLAAIRDHYDPALWPACARRLELAANWMDESAVYTIHSWCNRMLQQHAFDSGSLFHQEVKTDDTELMNEVVRDYWRCFYYAVASTDANFAKLYEAFQQPADLLNEIRPLLDTANPVAESIAAGQDINQLITAVNKLKSEQLQHLKQPWKDWLQEIKPLLATAIKNKVLPAKNYKSNYLQNWFDKIETWALNPLQETLDIGTGFTSLSPSGLLALANPGQTPPEHPAFEAISQLPEQLARLPRLKIELVKHAVHWIRNRYDQEKHRAARMTFDDMLTRLDHALQGDNGPRLTSVIRQQYPIALIDEFQDTDPVQYRIFSTLYPALANDNESGCFMIGDPKQAIYSFRGADIYTYLKAHQDTSGRHYTLGTNFRSTTALVTAVNQLFEHADQQAQGAFRYRSGTDNPLPFIAVQAKGRDKEWVIDGQAAPALSLWLGQTDDDKPMGMPEYRKTMAEVAASEIVRLLNLANQGATGFKSQTSLKPLQPSDIALLVRSGTEAKVLRNALAKRQLRSVYLSERDSIFATREAADLLLWLNALAEPRNERKVRAALGSATIGWTYQRLLQLALDEPAWEQQLERFLGYQQRWLQDGILPTLRQMMGDYDLHTRSTETSEGERCITNLLHLAELLQRASGQLEGEQALIRYLAEAIEAEGNPSGDEAIIRLESDANLIKIITIHKSKGLEYPVVFLPFICSFREINSRFNKHYRYHDSHRDLQIDLTKSEAARALSDEERLQEDLRLLYVAMTRARYACYLGLAAVKSGNTTYCQLEKSAMGSLLGWQAGMPTNALPPLLAQLKGDCDAIALSPLPAISPSHYQPPQTSDQADGALVMSTKITNNWWVASYSALQIEESQWITETPPQLPQELETAQDDKQNDEAELSLPPSAQPLIGIHSLARGSGPGVLVHDLLEQCARSSFSSVHANPTLQLELIQKRFNPNEWQYQHGIIAAALADWLAMPLLDGASLSLAQLTVGSYQAEMEFLVGADKVDVLAVDRLVTKHTFAGQARPRLVPKQINGLLKGFIDLVFVHNQKYYVVDYKFNSLGDDDTAYSPEALEKAMLAKRYDLQYALYLLALHRLLKVRLGEHYDYDSHIGGGLYLFLRGVNSATGGRVFNKPPKALITGLDDLFSAGEPL